MAISLKKGQKVNLRKHVTGGEILVNLNWNTGGQPEKKGFFASLFGGGKSGIDLDLACLVELKDGDKQCIQALGGNFGSLDRPPYVSLDGDDRTGDTAGGENLRINGRKVAEIKRVLVYTFIYEGVANWRETDAVVTIKCTRDEDRVFRMEEYGSGEPLCALAMIENVNDETFSVEPIIRFFRSQRYLDEAYGWGLRWEAGRK